MVVDELENGTTNVTLSGRIDMLGAQTIDSSFGEMADSKSAVLVDLSEVEFLGSWGIRVWLRQSRPPQRRQAGALGPWGQRPNGPRGGWNEYHHPDLPRSRCSDFLGRLLTLRAGDPSNLVFERW
jgi:hypothetical protein